MFVSVHSPPSVLHSSYWWGKCDLVILREDPPSAAAAAAAAAVMAALVVVHLVQATTTVAHSPQLQPRSQPQSRLPTPVVVVVQVVSCFFHCHSSALFGVGQSRFFTVSLPAVTFSSLLHPTNAIHIVFKLYSSDLCVRVHFPSTFSVSRCPYKLLFVEYLCNPTIPNANYDTTVDLNAHAHLPPPCPQCPRCLRHTSVPSYPGPRTHPPCTRPP